MKNRVWKRCLAVLVIVLFLSLGLLPGGALAAAAKKSQLVVAWIEFPAQGINPFNCKAGTDYAWNSIIYEPLWIPKFDGTTVPWLAKSWEYNKDKKAWIIHLDPRAKWHDGKPLTAEDVKYTFETAFKGNFDTAAKIQPLVLSIDVVDTHTVQFNMKEDYANFLWGASGAYIVPKHIWSKVEDPGKFINENPIGSGPFKFKEYKLEKYLLVVKNPSYWRGPVYIDEVLYKVFTNEEAKFMALQKGEVHALEEIRGTFTMIPTLQKDKNIKVISEQGPFSLHLMPNKRIYPLDIKEVRQAISLCINRKEIVDVGLAGYGEPANMGFLSPIYKAYAANIPSPNETMTEEQRMTKANALLDGLGFAKGPDGIRTTKDGKIKFRMRQPNWPSFVRMAEIMKENMKKIGIDVEVLPSDPGTVYRGIVYNAERTKDWEFLGPHDSTVRGLEYFSTEWGPETDSMWSGANASAWKHEEGQTILRKMRREMDPNKLKEMAKKAQEIFAEELPTITLGHKNMLYAYRTKEFKNWNTEMVVYGNMYYPVASLLNLTSVRPVTAK